MIATLAGLGLLACLVACGFVAAALGLRELDSGRAPRLGASYQIYRLLPLAWGRFVTRKEHT